MKKIIALLFTVVLLLSSTVTVFAADGKVTYSGNAGNFVLKPGSDHSLTDLFPNFKDVMPGDTLTQQITVKNNADNKVKVKIYMRSLGAHADSAEFLSKLNLLVEKSADNEMAYMFDAAANETAQLTDWVYLGTLYSGGKVDLSILGPFFRYGYSLADPAHYEFSLFPFLGYAGRKDAYSMYILFPLYFSSRNRKEDRENFMQSFFPFFNIREKYRVAKSENGNLVL